MKINPFPPIVRESVGYFEKCIVLGGMYPFDHWTFLGGTTYFQSGLELPNFQGLVHIIREFRQFGLSKSSNELETFKKVVLIHGRDNFATSYLKSLASFF